MVNFSTFFTDYPFINRWNYFGFLVRQSVLVIKWVWDYKIQLHQPSLSYIRIRLAEVQNNNSIKCQRDAVVTVDDCAQERRHRYSDDQVIDLGSIIFGFYCRTREMHNRGGRRVRFANDWSDVGPRVQVKTIIYLLLLLLLSSSMRLRQRITVFGRRRRSPAVA